MLSGLARYGSLASRAIPNRLNPFASRAPPPPPGIPGLPGLPSVSGISGMLGMPGAPSQRGVPPTKAPPTTKVTIAKIVALGLLSAFVGIFFMYLYKKEKEFNFDVIDKGIVVIALLLSGIAIAYFMKLDILNFIISSQINILCFYFLLSYASLTTFFSDVGFRGFLDVFRTVFDIIVDPTQIFEKGFSLIIPIIFFFIPVIVLIYNATESIILGILVLLSSAAITYSLYPKNKNPFTGGTPLTKTLNVKTCVENNWEYLNPLNLALPKCGETPQTCVDSNWSYANPFNWGKGRC
jgi:hypothetical protein